MKCKKCGNRMWKGAFLIKYGFLVFDGWICSCNTVHSDDGIMLGELWKQLSNKYKHTYLGNISPEDLEEGRKKLLEECENQ